MSQKLPMKIELEHPFELEGKTISEITIQKPTAWRCRAVKADKQHYEIDDDDWEIIVSHHSGVDELVIGEMVNSDFLKCRKVIMDYLTPSQEDDDDDVPGDKVSLPYALKLKVPYKYGGQEIAEIVFKNQIKQRYQRKAKIANQSWEGFLWIIGCMTGLTLPEVGDMSPRDTKRCIRIVYPFWTGGLMGESLSE